MHPNWQKFVFVFSVIVIVCLSLHHLLSKKQNLNNTQQSDNCQLLKTIKTVRSDSMEPLIEEGEELILMEGYSQCYPVEKGDIIVYGYKGSENPLI